MRWLALIPICAACSFSPGQPISGDATGTGSDAGSGSGSGSGSDAAVDAGCKDADHDGICDSVDDWLCGVKPSPPGDGGFAGRPTWIPMPSNVAFVGFGTGGAFKQTSPGATSTFSYAYGITVTCPSSSVTCNAQIEFGIAGVGRAGCLFDGTVTSGLPQGQIGRTAQITAPSVSGVYEVRAKIGMGQSCTGSPNWYGGTEPPSSGVFAYVCVP